MGMKNLLKSSLGASKSIKSMMRDELVTVESVSPLTKDSYVRSSGLHSLCPREETLRVRLNHTKEDVISSDLELIFQHGHGLHHQLQNSILPKLGIILGKWLCIKCGKMLQGDASDNDPVEKWAIRRPDSCDNCSGDEFLYHEADLVNEEHRITGHCDGFLLIPGRSGLGILEGKTISNGWQVANVPKLEHVVQLQTYMWLTGLEWGIILYWQKGVTGVNAFIEHVVDRDEDTILNIKNTLNELWDGVGGGDLPGRICASATCPRAKECSVVKECFSSEQ